MRFRTWPYRFAEQVLNSKLTIRKEIEKAIESVDLNSRLMSRPNLNEAFRQQFSKLGWEYQPTVFDEPKDPSARIDFLKERVGIEVAFTHSSFMGIDLLKFQTLSYSDLDKIDAGVYILITSGFMKKLITQYKQKWSGSLTFEKVCRYLPHFRSAIQVPIMVYGIEQ